MDIITYYLESHRGSINLRALVHSRNHLALVQSQKSFLSPVDIKDSFFLSNYMFSEEELDFHRALLMETCLQPCLANDGKIKLKLREDMIANDILFTSSLINTINIKAHGENFLSVQELKKNISIFLSAKIERDRRHHPSSYPTTTTSNSTTTTSSSSSTTTGSTSNSMSSSSSSSLTNSTSGSNNMIPSNPHLMDPNILGIDRRSSSDESPRYMKEVVTPILYRNISNNTNMTNTSTSSAASKLHAGASLAFHPQNSLQQQQLSLQQLQQSPSQQPQYLYPRKNIEMCEPVIRFLAQIRKQGMDILFPQDIHDKILCAIFVAVQLAKSPAHRELIDMVMAVKESNMFSNMQSVSKTKIRGILALLKHCDVMTTSGIEGLPVNLFLSPGVESFQNLRDRHDNYLLRFIHENHIPMPKDLWIEIVWKTDIDYRNESLNKISMMIQDVRNFYTRRTIPRQLLSPVNSENSFRFHDQSDQGSYPQTLSPSSMSPVSPNGPQTDILLPRSEQQYNSSLNMNPGFLKDDDHHNHHSQYHHNNSRNIPGRMGRHDSVEIPGLRSHIQGFPQQQQQPNHHPHQLQQQQHHHPHHHHQQQSLGGTPLGVPVLMKSASVANNVDLRNYRQQYGGQNPEDYHLTRFGPNLAREAFTDSNSNTTYDSSQRLPSVFPTQIPSQAPAKGSIFPPLGKVNSELNVSNSNSGSNSGTISRRDSNSSNSGISANHHHHHAHQIFDNRSITWNSGNVSSGSGNAGSDGQVQSNPYGNTYYYEGNRVGSVGGGGVSGLGHDVDDKRFDQKDLLSNNEFFDSMMSQKPGDSSTPWLSSQRDMRGGTNDISFQSIQQTIPQSGSSSPGQRSYVGERLPNTTSDSSDSFYRSFDGLKLDESSPVYIINRSRTASSDNSITGNSITGNSLNSNSLAGNRSDGSFHRLSPPEKQSGSIPMSSVRTTRQTSFDSTYDTEDVLYNNNNNNNVNSSNNNSNINNNGSNISIIDTMTLEKLDMDGIYRTSESGNRGGGSGNTIDNYFSESKSPAGRVMKMVDDMLLSPTMLA